MFGFSARSGLWEIRISCIMKFNYLKNHSRNLHAHLTVYFVRIQLSQSAVTPSSGRKLLQIVAHILQKAFFKHALAKKGEHK